MEKDEKSKMNYLLESNMQASMKRLTRSYCGETKPNCGLAKLGQHKIVTNQTIWVSKVLTSIDIRKHFLLSKWAQAKLFHSHPDSIPFPDFQAVLIQWY